MKYLLLFLIFVFALTIGGKILKIVCSEIKRDPVANLLIPAATALVTSLLLQWLRML